MFVITYTYTCTYANFIGATSLLHIRYSLICLNSHPSIIMIYTDLLTWIGQNLITGVTTCFPNGSLSVTIATRDGWNSGYASTVTVRYICWNPDGNEARNIIIYSALVQILRYISYSYNMLQIKSGSLWNATIFIGPYYSTRTVESMHQESWCQVYSCYSPDECNFYSINMTSRSSCCSFKTGKSLHWLWCNYNYYTHW